MRIKRKMLNGLDARESVFVIEYMKDFSPRRAAEASGYAPDTGHGLLLREHIMSAIQRVMDERMEEAGIDAEWLLYELVDNHRIARQQGNISASNTALLTLAKHVSIDALAKQKVELDVVSDRDLIERLQRGRERLSKSDEDEVSFL